MTTPALPLALTAVWAEMRLTVGTGGNLNNPILRGLRNWGNWPNPPSSAQMKLSQLASKNCAMMLQAVTVSTGNGVFTSGANWLANGKLFGSSATFGGISGASSSVLQINNTGHVYTGSVTLAVFSSDWSTLITTRTYTYNAPSGANDTWWTQGVALGLTNGATYNFVIYY